MNCFHVGKRLACDRGVVRGFENERVVDPASAKGEDGVIVGVNVRVFHTGVFESFKDQGVRARKLLNIDGVRVLTEDKGSKSNCKIFVKFQGS